MARSLRVLTAGKNSNNETKNRTKSMCDKEKQDTPRIGALRTPSDCRRELARVYKLGRKGEIETAHMTRFANVLQIMVGMIRDTELEERLQRLEEILSSRTGVPGGKRVHANH